MKHASCGLQNQEGSHSQRDSLAACLGGNITSPSSWTPWASASTSPLGVIATGGMVGVVSFVQEVAPVLEVGDAFVEPPPLQAVADGRELLVLSVDFGDDGAPVGLELGASLVVALVTLHLGGGREVERTDRRSQCEKRTPCGLEEFLTPVGHGVELSL
jgi:hypothetical protein